MAAALFALVCTTLFSACAADDHPATGIPASSSDPITGLTYVSGSYEKALSSACTRARERFQQGLVIDHIDSTSYPKRLWTDEVISSPVPDAPSQWLTSIQQCTAGIQATQAAAAASAGVAQSFESKVASASANCENGLYVSPADPASVSGTCGHLFVTVTQRDANTGPCSFRGDYSNSESGRDGENALFDLADCKTTWRVGYIYEVVATASGTTTYTTALNAETTVARFTQVRQR